MDHTTQSPDRSRSSDVVLLCTAAMAVIAAYLLQILPDGRVALLGWEQYPLPHSCLTRALFGWACPGCGLTRSFILLLHGDWLGAWNLHPVGWLFGLLILVQVPYRIVAIRCPERTWIPTWASTSIVVLLMILTIAQWLWRLAIGTLPI